MESTCAVTVGLLFLSLLAVTSASPQLYGPPPYPAPPPYPQQRPQPQPQPQPFWPGQQFGGYNYSDYRGYPGAQRQPQPPPPPQNNYYQGSGGGYLGYPQIYKVDNLIIIANNPTPQACPPVRPIIPPKQPTGLDNRNEFGSDPDMPSDCTWAIIACCSPGYRDVRYNCFELLGCNGFFFDDSACAPNVVTAASRAAFDFYRSNNKNSNNNRTSTATADNKL